MSVWVVRTLADLDAALTLAPERHRTHHLDGGEGEALRERAIERRERVAGDALRDAVVFDTTHARDGVLDVAAALRAKEPPSSGKKRVRAGDLLVSRLRPYLRQIAYVHPACIEALGDRVVCCSTEFYVLSPRGDGARDHELAYLLPWLLGAPAQAILAAAQEGGHHPRVPRETLLAMRVPQEIVASRRRASRRVADALEAVYAAMEAWTALLR